MRRVDLPAPPGTDWDDTREVVAGDGTRHCEPASAVREAPDTRSPFTASGYVGYALDNFAPGSVGGYDADALGGQSRKRYVAGVDFEFRVAGQGDRQLWIFGETLNGVRSADVECEDEQSAAVCGPLLENHAEQFRYILEQATSKESFVGVRVELLPQETQEMLNSRAFRNFPWFSTFAENIPYVMRLKREQVTVLAGLAAWSITNPVSQKEIATALGL